MPVHPAPSPRSTASAEARLPLLRLVPSPASEPPYDDEDVPRRSHTAARPLLRSAGGTTAAPVTLPHTAPDRDVQSYPPLRLVPREQDGRDDRQAAGRPTARTALDALAPVKPFTHALVQRLLEVIGGVRPVSQLQRDTTPELFARLERFVLARPQARGARPSTGAVRSVHVQARPEGVAEACATVRRGARTHALAMRLEGVGGRWCCTDLQGLQLP